MHGRKLASVAAAVAGSNGGSKGTGLGVGSAAGRTKATGAGSASPVVSIRTWSNFLSRFARLVRALMRSPRTVQQTQLGGGKRRPGDNGQATEHGGAERRFSR